MRIAVLLAGQLRNWETTSKIFKLYNQILPHTHYDFFLSTWDDSYNGKKSIECDFSFINAYEIISTSVLNTKIAGVPWKVGDNAEEYKVYPYLFKRVNQLKNDYQNEHDIKYDYIISTRPDIYLNLPMLEVGYNIIKNTIYIPNGIVKKISSITKKEIVRMEDMVLFGDDSVINIHANLYDDIHVKNILSHEGIHLTQANHIVSNDISYKSKKLPSVTSPMNNPPYVIPVRNNMVNYLEDLYKSGNLKELYNPLSTMDILEDVTTKLKELEIEHNKNNEKTLRN